ncbi:hypothetical protein ACFFJI_00060 [Allobacillus sp. GCM10007491]|uniref:Uncharacterized protein n=1 Tax=Allobacillus saliphilus TaxID=2912308 RepID=A0A941HUH7_9BACI|nr:hypothetical protein [Allobacillus saliphilus]MBR7554905.1 hypothetical protein [Allobacillus saliphilus]
MKTQSLIARQPDELKQFEMKNDRFYMISLRHVHFGPKTFKIILENKHQTLEVIYDQFDPAVPVSYYVWNFRYGTEMTRTDLQQANRKYPSLVNKDCYYYFKVQNSEFIKWNDFTSSFKSKDFPELEHHLYFTDNDILEVLSLYEPKFIVVDK